MHTAVEAKIEGGGYTTSNSESDSVSDAVASVYGDKGQCSSHHKLRLSPHNASVPTSQLATHGP